MSEPIVPCSKIGTPFQSPSWRYQATFCPERFGFASLCSKTKSNAGNLARLISNGIVPVEKYIIPLYIRQLQGKLEPGLYTQLIKVWNKFYCKNRHGKITFNVNETRPGLLNWNVRKISQLNDHFLQKLIKHCYNIEGDEYIKDAIKFYKNENNDVTCKWLNYSIYGGKTDKELALQWRKPVKFIEAIRLIFFDYSGWPTDKLVQYSLIRQLASNNEIDAADHHAFKRIYDLGDLGLRSILGHQALSEPERDIIKGYLAGSGVDNLLDQRFAITNLKESISFNRSVAEYANIGLRKLEMEQKAAIMRLTANRMERELGVGREDEVYVEDSILMDSMREMMKQEKPGTYPSIIDIKSEDVKTVIRQN
jgi:hypothetical protein